MNAITSERPRTSALLLALFLWVLLLRAPTFLRAAIDWDEGLYIVIASQWLAGHVPYSTIFEIKPIGIFAIFAAALRVFGESIESVRFLTVGFVFATSVSVHFLGVHLLGSWRAGVIAAGAYPVLTLGMQGLSSNTELFFIFFNTLGLLLLLRAVQRERPGRFGVLGLMFLAGLSFGVAVQIKYIVAIEVAMFLGYFFVAHHRSVHARPAMLFTLLVGLAVPSLLALGYLWAQGVLDLFVESNFLANRRYVASGNQMEIWAAFRHSLQDWIKWTWPVLAAAAFFAWKGRVHRKQRGEGAVCVSFPWFLTLWMAAGFMEAFVTLKFYRHYYLVTMPALSLLLAYSMTRLDHQFTKRWVSSLVLAVALGIPLALVVRQYYTIWISTWASRGDTTMRVARYLREEVGISEREFLYVVNGQPVLYFLTGARLPTRFIFPPMIILESASQVAGVEFQKEIDAIFAKTPRAIVIRDDSGNNLRVNAIRARVQSSYHLSAKIEDYSVYVWKTAHSDQ